MGKLKNALCYGLGVLGLGSLLASYGRLHYASTRLEKQVQEFTQVKAKVMAQHGDKDQDGIISRWESYDRMYDILESNGARFISTTDKGTLFKPNNNAVTFPARCRCHPDDYTGQYLVIQLPDDCLEQYFIVHKDEGVIDVPTLTEWMRDYKPAEKK